MRHEMGWNNPNNSRYRRSMSVVLKEESNHVSILEKNVANNYSQNDQVKWEIKKLVKDLHELSQFRAPLKNQKAVGEIDYCWNLTTMNVDAQT